MRPRGRLLPLVLLPILAVCALAQSVAGDAAGVWAVGDVHGSYPQFLALLQRIGLLDRDRQWIGGAGVLVQTGDIPNRGAQTRQCFDLLMEMERQAEKHGGRVIPLLGNHEVMNMMGDLRYVAPEDYAGFATGESEKVREQAYQEYRKFLASRSSHLRRPAAPDDPAAREKWMAERPPGFFEQRDGYGPRGLYGSWLRKHDAVAQLGDAVFLHGGLSPKLRFRNLGELNNRIRSELANFDSIWKLLSDRKIIWRYMKLEEALREVQDELAAIQARGQADDPEALQKMQELLRLQSWMALSPDGPLWYRGYAKDPEESLKADLETVLGRLKARHIVVGHTITDTHRITPRGDGRVFLIDTAMLLEGKGGRASALEIQNGRFTAHYLNGEQQVLLGPPAGAVPATSPLEGEAHRMP